MSFKNIFKKDTLFPCSSLECVMINGCVRLGFSGMCLSAEKGSKLLFPFLLILNMQFG